MQGQSQQQAYDRGITIFSPDGRLYQVEYAREAVKRGTASIGVRTADGVVLAVDKRIRSPLMERSSVEKIHKADDHIGIASAGHVADARQLIDFARRQTQVNQLRYGEAIGVETLTKQVTDHIQQYTQIGGARPFGVALIIAGVSDGEPRLYETDPSGTPYEWKALAIGADRGDIREYLEANYDEEMDLDAGVGLALEAMAAVNDGELAPEGIGVATISVEDAQFSELTDDQKQAHLDDLGLLPAADEAPGDEAEDTDEEATDESDADETDDE
ncbi:archaeal proteasome endopeptidase complex subunit alpha [Halorhabdus sp. CBA1104]|uniref:archaeal proteasome endopeptidase complex subunit alpha n=1 Tax=unclassified Halorhabdus TaxID=2621901 RepID=UPI0012B30954|nr:MULTISPECIES: archaeal proteasome endopeptidase complex subunit alpha [unclassified Halorhabdus]QGN07086.1 archaeal proteasome endopeptidase complex subunit alpha [Halorhabdus sp. CBA1104]